MSRWDLGGSYGTLSKSRAVSLLNLFPPLLPPWVLFSSPLPTFFFLPPPYPCLTLYPILPLLSIVVLPGDTGDGVKWSWSKASSPWAWCLCPRWTFCSAELWVPSDPPGNTGGSPGPPSELQVVQPAGVGGCCSMLHDNTGTFWQEVF